MKKSIIVVITILFVFTLNAQINYNNNTVTGSNASALGEDNSSSGTNSFVSGSNSVSSNNYSTALGLSVTASGMTSCSFGAYNTAQGHGSVVLGSRSTAIGTGAIAIGNKVDALAQYSYVIGYGLSDYHLENNILNSLMIGFQSDIPTFFVGPGSGQGTLGNVGIGTSNPQSLLDIAGTLNVNSLATFGNDLNVTGKSTMAQIQITQGAGVDMILSSDASGLASWVDPGSIISNDNDWTIDINNIYRESGNVGIGTVSPQVKLHIEGNQFLSGYLDINGISYLNRIILDNDSDISGVNEIKGFDDLKLFGDNTDGPDIMITADGMVGIGIPEPLATLDVNGTIKSHNNILLNGNWLSGDGDDEGIFVDISGKVGIGTSNPSVTLDVKNESVANQIISNFEDSYGKRIYLVPRLDNSGHNPISRLGDMGIFWSDGHGYESQNYSAGLVIGPYFDQSPWDPRGIRIDSIGNVGIGLTDPQCLLHIDDDKGNLDATFLKISNENVSAGGSTMIGKRMGNGPVFIQQAGNINFTTSGPCLSFKQKANNGDEGLDISTYTDENGDINWASIFTPNSNLYLCSSEGIIFRTGVNKYEIVYFKDDGKVGIGTGDPQAKLDVNGGIKCNEIEANSMNIDEFSVNTLTVSDKLWAGEIEVTDISKWKDEVFEKDYNLTSLSELEKYIQKHHHLPDIPSEAEVMENGINVGEMNALLLQKIEELTLYVIELEKKINEINNENK